MCCCDKCLCFVVVLWMCVVVICVSKYGFLFVAMCCCDAWLSFVEMYCWDVCACVMLFCCVVDRCRCNVCPYVAFLLRCVVVMCGDSLF